MIQEDYIYHYNNQLIEMGIILLLILLTTLAVFIKRTLFCMLLSGVLIAGFIVGGYYYFLSTNMLIPLLFPLIGWLISFGLIIVYKLFSEQKQKEKISKLFSKKVSKKVMDNLVENTSQTQIAHERETTIFFSDIRGFTPISEKLSAIELVKFLNDYMTPMANIIDERFGTIDKFIGDAIMAYWNAPFDLPNHADYAVDSAIEQIIYLRNMQEDIHEKYGVELDIGIGINTGEVVVGEIGSTGRSDYTVIGDPVNLASRVESLNKKLFKQHHHHTIHQRPTH